MNKLLTLDFVLSEYEKLLFRSLEVVLFAQAIVTQKGVMFVSFDGLLLRFLQLILFMSKQLPPQGSISVKYKELLRVLQRVLYISKIAPPRVIMFGRHEELPLRFLRLVVTIALTKGG